MSGKPRKFGMRDRRQQGVVWGALAACFILSVVLSERLRPGHAQYVKAAQAISGDPHEDAERQSALGGSAFQALMPSFTGLREVFASLMWVRADDYFHSGEYRPIIRMVKQITAIDPHQLDVYATGAWHMAYNFMDKRLIADGVQFLEEGCRNNSTVYDLFFELGYMHYDKTKDYKSSVAAYRQGAEKRTTTGKAEAPAYVRHQLAHAIEKMGDIDGSIQQWEVNVEKAEALEKAGEVSISASGPNLPAARHNLYITARRRNERLASLAERDGDVKTALELWQANLKLAEDWLKREAGTTGVQKDRRVAQNQVGRLQAGKLNPVPPAELNLKFKVTRTKPRELLIEGTFDALELSRVHVRFQDKDYDERAARGLEYKMANCTLEWDNPSVRQGRFRHVLDLNRDPAEMERNPADIYPLKADEYELSVTYNPRFQAAFIQDRYGWSGEGLAIRPDMLAEDPERASSMLGRSFPLRMIRKTVRLTREDITGPGKKVLVSQ